MLRMDRVHVIRHAVLIQGRSVRSVARELGVSRNTVRRYLEESEPVRVEQEARPRPVYQAVQGRLHELLEEWAQRTTRKQRITGTRLQGQLVKEGHPVGTTLVRQCLREWRRKRQEVYVPLVHRPGEEGQVDFFEVTAEVAGVREPAWMFLMHSMYSERDFGWVYERADQLSFLDGHVRGFGHFGAVFQRLIYDNLSSAVKKVVMPERELTERFRALASHYLFEPCFARPGEGHDKGGVEGRGRGVRLQHLVPVPRGETLRGISEQLLRDLDEQAETKRDLQGRSVKERFAEELSRMRPLPEAPFDPRKVILVTASRMAKVQVEGAAYSVPSRWAGLEVTAHVGVEDVRFVCRGEEVVRPRQRFGGKCIRYRDYLPELRRKPQAVRQVAPELVEELGEPFGRLWRFLEASHGPREAARVLARVVGAMEDHGEEAVREALVAALDADRADLLALACRLTRRGPVQVAVPAALAGYEVESARAADYDVLLMGGEA